jgi:predicted phosphodiesterase
MSMSLNQKKYWLFILIILSLNTVLCGQQKGNRKGENAGNRNENQQEGTFFTSVPSHDYDIILGRPTNNSITFSVLLYQQAESYIAIREQHSLYIDTIRFVASMGKPTEILYDRLKPDSRYLYHLCYKIKDQSDYLRSSEYYFQTQRIYDEPFSFTITADSHLDQNTDVSTYKATLTNAQSDSADFHIDLGDTFMTDKYRENYKDALSQYIAQRYYFGLLCNSSPLFLVLGNHDGESAPRMNGKNENITTWSNSIRKTYFANPIPDIFYSGNNTKDPILGQPQDYFSFEWGNSLFIILDPFLYTSRNGMDDPWQRTLGKNQYDWLKSTLEKSKAKFKFIFIHNLVGGTDLKGKARGGSEVANLFEWGGLNQDGSSGFKEHRPDWEMPIHALLKKHGVTAVFHGHDHLFAKQELDGIIYQCLPQPGAKAKWNTRSAEEYGYINGVILNSPGYLRVLPSKDQVKIDFINTSNRDVEYSYTIKSK